MYSPQNPDSAAPDGFNAAFVAPKFAHDPDWPWITEIGPMANCRFVRQYIDNTCDRLPKATWLYRRMQFAQAAQAIRDRDLAFLFSVDITRAMTGWAARLCPAVPKVYVGFTQDGPWAPDKLEWVGRTLQRCDLVCTFTDEERDVYMPRYGLRPDQIAVVPIHTDEPDGYEKYSDESPLPEPFVLALGSPNRHFAPTARLCQTLGVPLVIMTRPTHVNDSLNELRDLGATVITSADKMRALTYLKHARLAVMPFMDPRISGGYTTLMHAMFMGTPFVATECLGIREHVIDGETGFVAAHGDYDGLGHAIHTLWDQPDLARRFGEASRARAHERHSLEAASASYFRIGQSIRQGESRRVAA